MKMHLLSLSLFIYEMAFEISLFHFYYFPKDTFDGRLVDVTSSNKYDC